MRRITKAALGGIAGCALALGATQWAAGASDWTTLNFARRLIDVRADGDGYFDGAKAQLQISETAGKFKFTISIQGIDPRAARAPETDLSFGAHVHTGSCVKNDFGPPGGMQAGGHYQHVPLGPAGANRENEVWFDLFPTADGTAKDDTTVDFVVDPGPDKERSIVIHVDPTNESTGGAGAREACLPLDYEDLQ